jgi:hypothetical protein
MATARSEVTRDLPTPPLPLTMPMTFLIWLRSCGFSEKTTAFSEQPWLQLLQSELQDDVLFDIYL